MSGTSEPAPAGSEARQNPFVGPRPIQQGEALHGRKQEVRELYEHLTGHRIVVLHSPSGAGKSSLVHAGLIPRLREAKFDVWRPIRVNLDPATYESVPVDVNRFLLSALVNLEDELPATHRRSPAELAKLGFLEYLDARPRRKGRSIQSVVLLFDQFEEIISIAPRAIEAKRAFFAAVGAALDTGRYWALFVLREDYLAALAPYRDLIPTQLTNTYRLDLLDQDGAHEAASKLAEEGGRSFPGVERLVRDLSVVQVQQPDGSFVAEQGIHVEPVYLQVVCRRLWAALPDGTDSIDEAAVEAYAQVSKSLAGYYADAVAAIAGDDAHLERTLRDWVGTRLIVGGIRSQVRQHAAGDGDLSPVHIQKLLDSYLIRSEQRAGAYWFELSHDRLVEPVLQDNDAWQQAHLHPLQVRAKLWEAGGRAQALLLGADALRDASTWADANPRRLTAGEREFMALSREQHDRQVRLRRRRQIFTAALAVVAVVAVVFAKLAIEARDDSNKRREEADEARDNARADQARAEAAEATARTAQTEAEQARTQAEKSQKENERSVRQMFEVALRPAIDRLIKDKQAVGVVEVDGRWTPLLANDSRTLVAATLPILYNPDQPQFRALGESVRVVVAGHESVLSGAETNAPSLFLEITAQWLLADQARRKVAIVTRQTGRNPRLEALERDLLRLDLEVELHVSLSGDAALAEAGMVLLDSRWTTALGADEVAVLEAFVRRGGGLLAVGRGQTWLGTGPPPKSLDSYPMNQALAAFGARWSNADVGPQELAQREVAAIVRFENRLTGDVNLYVKTAGREEYYTTLTGNETRELLTALRSEWVFRATVDGRALGNVVIANEAQTVSIGATVNSMKVTPSTPSVPPPEDPSKPPQREKLSESDLQAGYDKAAQAAKACGNKFKTLMAEIKVDVKIGGNGKVASVEVQGQNKGTNEAGCIVPEVSKLTFPRSQQGGKATWTLKLF